MTLPSSFLNRPIAHRALHGAGRVENSMAAIDAAIARDFPIEIDVQLTADDEAIVFHDYDLRRLTPEMGPVRQRSSAQLQTMPYMAGPGTIPVLADVLDRIAGRVPLVVEIKDQDGALGADVGKLEAAVARAIEGYSGDLAVMSFNPHAVWEMKRLCPDVPRGLVTEDFQPEEWPVPVPTLERLRGIPDYDHVGASFISHKAADLSRPRVSELKTEGALVLCWTIRSAEQEKTAREIADNVTFEGYDPDA